MRKNGMFLPIFPSSKLKCIREKYEIIDKNTYVESKSISNSSH